MDHYMTALNNLEFIERKEPQELVIEEIGYQTLLEREVVVKRLTPVAAGNPRLRHNFIKVARTLASLPHPNLINVYDAGLDGNNLAYVVLEKPEGVTLQQRLDLLNGQNAQMVLEEIEQIINDIGAAVEHLHQHHILLHSLALDKIILRTDGRAVLTGLGEPLPEDILTIPPRILAYTAPERLLGSKVDNRSDIYALGVLLYHLLSGRLPFEGNPLAIIAQKQNAAGLPPLDCDDGDLPYSSALVEIMRRATDQTPNERYSNVAVFRTELARAVENPFHQLEPYESLATNIGQNGQNDHHVHTNGKTQSSRGMNGSSSTGIQASIAASNLPVNGAYKNGTAEGYALSESPINTILRQRPAPDQVQTDLSDRQEKIEIETRTEIQPQPQTADSAGLDAIQDLETVGATQAEIDPLMPGRDNPALREAIPYTILVPMPEATTEPEPELTTAPEADPVAFASWNKTVTRSWFLWISVLGILGVVAALKLG